MLLSSTSISLSFISRVGGSKYLILSGGKFSFGPWSGIYFFQVFDAFDARDFPALDGDVYTFFMRILR